MAILIEEQFQVEAPIEPVWAYLSNPPRVAPCLPGAQLTEIVDERTFKGQVKVQVGPVVAQYQGTVILEAMDAESHSATMVGRGTQMGAAGRAEGRMTYTLRSLDGQGTEIVVNAEVNVTGRLAQLGGGMIQSVSKQLFREFVDCVRQQILAEQAASVEASPGAETSAPAQEAPGDRAPVAPSPSAQRPVAASPGKPVNALALGGRVLLKALLGLIAQGLRALLNAVERLEKAL